MIKHNVSFQSIEFRIILMSKQTDINMASMKFDSQSTTLTISDLKTKINENYLKSWTPIHNELWQNNDEIDLKQNYINIGEKDTEINNYSQRLIKKGIASGVLDSEELMGDISSIILSPNQQQLTYFENSILSKIKLVESIELPSDAKTEENNYDYNNKSLLKENLEMDKWVNQNCINNSILHMLPETLSSIESNSDEDSKTQQESKDDMKYSNFIEK